MQVVKMALLTDWRCRRGMENHQSSAMMIDCLTQGRRSLERSAPTSLRRGHSQPRIRSHSPASSFLDSTC